MDPLCSSSLHHTRGAGLPRPTQHFADSKAPLSRGIVLSRFNECILRSNIFDMILRQVELYKGTNHYLEWIESQMGKYLHTVATDSHAAVLPSFLATLTHSYSVLTNTPLWVQQYGIPCR